MPTPEATRRPRPNAGKVVGEPEIADVDGDGRLDRATLRVGDIRGRHAFWRDPLVVHFASGQRARVLIDDWGSRQHAAPRLLGHADVNGDGRAELVVDSGAGNTVHGGQIITYVRGRMRQAGIPDRYRDGTPYLSSPLSYYGHGNSCYPWCEVGSYCHLVNGRPRLVTINGRVDDPRWNFASPPPGGSDSLHRSWVIDIYDLRGARMVREARVRGEGTLGQPLPSNWVFQDSLICGTAIYGPAEEGLD